MKQYDYLIVGSGSKNYKPLALMEENKSETVGNASPRQ